MYDVRENLARVRERVAAALTRAGRSDAVTIVAVTKTHPLDAVHAAEAAGLTVVGENRVQEMEAKRAEYGDGALEWHLIGHLQRNKARTAVRIADLIHSVDSLRLARELSKEAERADRTVRVLVQVNASGEESKGGFDPARAVDDVLAVCALPGLQCEGLMTMAPLTDDERIIRDTFRGARDVLERVLSQGAAVAVPGLSMGMSGDYEVAIEEGSTMIRLGTTLFGERPA